MSEDQEETKVVKITKKTAPKEQSFFQYRTNSYIKYMSLKWSNTRLANNLDNLSRFQKIYTHLMTNKLPILKGGERRKKAKRAEQIKTGVFIAFTAFFFMYNRMGVINRLMFCLLSSQGLTYLTKCNFYKQCVDELSYEMTVTGQESRILMQYYFENHPQTEIYQQMCQKYQEHSKSQKDQEIARKKLISGDIDRQQRLDDEFAERLRKFDRIE